MSACKYTYEEIRRFIGVFSDEMLAELAKGPLPEEDGASRRESCRVCAVLETPDMQGPAFALIDWHDFVSKGLGLVRKVIDGDLGEVENALIEDVQGLIGSCSYARCCVIYGLAEAELEKRRRQNVEADEEFEEPLSPEEKRLDEEFEDADRRNDAEKVGDL